MDDAVFATKNICLSDIRRKAEWVRNDANDLATYTKLLVSLPTWETEAEETILQAAVALQTATRLVGDVAAFINQKRLQKELT